MAGNDHLLAYLNDHLSGSEAALQLMQHQLKVEQAADAQAFYNSLYSDIEADQKILEEIIRHAGSEPSQLRRAGGWVAEKFVRVKLLLTKASSGPIEHFEALEVLLLGIHGKSALWRALAVTTPQAIAGIDLDVLQRRAQDQIDRVEARRLIVARRALASAA